MGGVDVVRAVIGGKPACSDSSTSSTTTNQGGFAGRRSASTGTSLIGSGNGQRALGAVARRPRGRRQSPPPHAHPDTKLTARRQLLPAIIGMNDATPSCR